MQREGSIETSASLFGIEYREKPMRSGSRTYQRILLTVLCSGGALFQVTSCSPGVRDAVLQGLETTSTTFANILLSALFAGLGNGG